MDFKEWLGKNTLCPTGQIGSVKLISGSYITVQSLSNFILEKESWLPKYNKQAKRAAAWNELVKTFKQKRR